MEDPVFDHEKLEVYKKALEFVSSIHQLKEELGIKSNLFDQLERSSASIPLNIAEGNGKYTGKDKYRYFDIAGGSALESASALDVLLVRKVITKEQNIERKIILKNIVSMLVGLIKSKSDRVYEKEIEYNS